MSLNKTKRKDSADEPSNIFVQMRQNKKRNVKVNVPEKHKCKKP